MELPHANEVFWLPRFRDPLPYGCLLRLPSQNRFMIHWNLGGTTSHRAGWASIWAF